MSTRGANDTPRIPLRYNCESEAYEKKEKIFGIGPKSIHPLGQIDLSVKSATVALITTKP